jgi:hypothetical protein
MAKHKSEISVLNKKIPVKIEDIDIFALKFWPENPRVNSAIKKRFGTKEVSNEDIEAILRDEEHVKELFQDIKKHGGLIDEIVVRNNIVLEGNSRLCAYRMLYEKADKEKDDEDLLRWSYIKAKVIPNDTTEEEIFTILGTWHIKGKKQWDTFEKAAYLKKMQANHKYQSDKIAEIIGETKTFVDHTIEAHDLMIDNKVYEPEKYSYFIEMVKNKGINQEQEKDPWTRSKIIAAIKNNQFNRAEEIRDVHKVLKDKVARRSFFEEEANFEDALNTAVERHPELEGALFGLLKKVSTRLGNVEVKEIDRLRQEISSDTNKKDIARRFYKVVKKFCKQIGISDEKKNTTR